MAINKEPKDSSSDAKSNSSENPSKINDTGTSRLSLPKNKNRTVEENSLMPVTTPTSSPINSATNSHHTAETIAFSQRRHWWQAWQLWGILLVLCSGGVGYAATSMLLKLPKTQSCSKVFWPIASASVRLYCAQTAAEENDVRGLLAAIELVAVLPDNHPLRPEINRNVEKWATGILEIGEQEFQEGNLKKAIATARQIPKTLEANKLVEAKIESWESIWSRAENNYAQVEKRLREANWNEAFSWAVRLTDSPNQYWATTKYQESINNINIAQEENATLGKAQIQLASGKIDDLLLAIDKADDIDEKSYAYEQAREIIAQAKEKLLITAEQLIEQENWQQLLQITNRVPYSLKLQKKVEDWNILANAGSSASLDTVFGMEEAIIEAEKLEPNSPYYQRAQKLIARWELEMEDVRHLSQAREFARVGTIANLNKAIAEANLIPDSNPRYGEARQEINNWRREIQIIEDRPILNRARELAFADNIEAWQEAIDEASLISSNSPLYGEAQDYIRTWRASIQRKQDQPFLDEAVAFANAQNYAAAINSAQKIKSGRVLYDEARDKINLWQQEIDGAKYLREANYLSNQGTPESLSRAIKVARQVATDSSLRTQVVRNVNLWSAEILAMARQASNNSLERAIAIAEQVPSGTVSYSDAQSEIKNWQERLNSPQPEITPLPPRFKLEKLKKNRSFE